MFTRLGAFTVRRRKAVLAGTLLVLVLAGVLGSGVFGRLAGGGFDDPSSQSSRALTALKHSFGTGVPDYVLLVTAHGAPSAINPGNPAVDAPDVTSAATALQTRLAHDPRVAEVLSYWSLGKVSPLRSKDGNEALIVTRLAGDQTKQLKSAKSLNDEILGRHGAISVGSGGQSAVFQAVSSRIEKDLTGAESIAVPITLVLLVLVFGGLVAASLPLLVGVISVLGTFFTLWVITQFTDVSVFSINLVTALGLGLAIDYSLFVVSRYREELRAGRSVEAAIIRTVETAGRTIAVSALTVAISLSALLVFPLYFLRSFAYAGVGVTLVAMAASVITLPALLATLGHRVDALQLWKRRPPAEVGQGFWHRLATGVMKRPVVVSLAVIALLVFLGAPFFGVNFGTSDQRVLPTGTAARTVTDKLQTDFPSQEASAMPVVAPSAHHPTDTAIDTYADRLSKVAGVTRVDAPTGRFIAGKKVIGPDATLAGYRASDGSGAVRFSVVPNVVPISKAGETLVHDLRTTPSTVGPTLIGGQSAALVDSKASIGSRLPWAGGIIAVTTFLLLFLMFGSVLVPVKAIVLNVLSLTATFGAMVWIFQDGHGAGLLGFTATGFTDITTPILMFCIAFGLSMDYEVFLLSRIKEEHDRTGDNPQSVAVGLEHTGRIVTAAAALLAVTFIAFSTSGITFIKLFGLGLALAVIMDATLIRATLVPAFMKLAGEANWWAPAWMKRIQERIGFSESEPVDDQVINVEPIESPVLAGAGAGTRLGE
jgi:RND superfamily putative drug exporter